MQLYNGLQDCKPLWPPWRLGPNEENPPMPCPRTQQSVGRHRVGQSTPMGR